MVGDYWKYDRSYFSYSDLSQDFMPSMTHVIWKYLIKP